MSTTSSLSSIDLTALYQELNWQYFEAALPSCQLNWSRRLRRSAGLIGVERREITLSLPLLVDVWAQNARFEVCGVFCDSPLEAVREILKHEMIHLWLFVQGLPHGHTPAFRAKARQMGQPKTRHNIALPPAKSGWVYRCAACGHSFVRRRRYGRPVACARCCHAHSRGRFDARFLLRGCKAVSEADVKVQCATQWPPR